MKIVFAPGTLALIESHRAAETNLPIGVIQSARIKLTALRAAPDIRTIQGWQSLGYRSANYGSSAEHSIVVTPGWELNMHFEIEQGVTYIVVIGVRECRREFV